MVNDELIEVPFVLLFSCQNWICSPLFLYKSQLDKATGESPTLDLSRKSQRWNDDDDGRKKNYNFTVYKNKKNGLI